MAETVLDRLFERLDAAALKLANLQVARAPDNEAQRRLRAEMRRVTDEIRLAEMRILSTRT